MEMVDWSRLPYDLVKAIANQIGEVEDFASFLGVCSSWRSAVAKQEWNPCVTQLPWLILAESSGSSTTRGFYNIGKNKRYDLNVPETHGRRCWGSAIGWMFTVGVDFQAHLFNPLSHVQISLPPLTTFEHHPDVTDPNSVRRGYSVRTDFVYRAYVMNGTGTGTGNDIVVMAIHGHFSTYLALARPGYESWVSLQDAGTSFGGTGFHDVVVFKDQIFAALFDGTLVLCEIEGPDPPKTSDYALPPFEVQSWERIYLVESAGELWMVSRAIRRGNNYEIYYKTLGFVVYKFDFSARKWTQLLDLGDRTLFVGDSYSMSLKAADPNCKTNSIYFTDDCWNYWEACQLGGGHDMGIFNMETMTFDSRYLGDDCRSPCSPPTWITPRFA